jgi:hypothetical protein
MGCANAQISVRSASGQGVLDIDAEIAHGAFDLCVTQQNLHRAEVARLLVDDGRLGSPERMRAVILSSQADPCDPLVHEPSILPGADVTGLIDPAGKDEVGERAASTFQSSKNAAPG